MAARGKARSGGRPPKFDEPRRPVTMTLPERTLSLLSALDADRASAIVKLVDSSMYASPNGKQSVELIEVAPGAAVILVPPSRCLREIPWLKLAEVTPGRYLLTLASGTPIESLEVAILDFLDTLSPDDGHERKILGELRRLIAASRRDRNLSRFEMLYVDSSVGRRRRAAQR